MNSLAHPTPQSMVWVVDDDEFVLRGISRLLRSAGCDVQTFASARACLDHQPHNGPICVVLDLRMPDFGGLDMQRALLDREAQIVFLTGYGDVPTCVHAMNRGRLTSSRSPLMIKCCYRP